MCRRCGLVFCAADIFALASISSSQGVPTVCNQHQLHSSLGEPSSLDTEESKVLVLVICEEGKK